MDLQRFKESTSARYLFLCLKLASNEVSRLSDTEYHTDVIVSRQIKKVYKNWFQVFIIPNNDIKLIQQDCQIF